MKFFAFSAIFIVSLKSQFGPVYGAAATSGSGLLTAYEGIARESAGEVRSDIMQIEKSIMDAIRSNNFLLYVLSLVDRIAVEEYVAEFIKRKGTRSLYFQYDPFMRRTELIDDFIKQFRYAMFNYGKNNATVASDYNEVRRRDDNGDKFERWENEFFRIKELIEAPDQNARNNVRSRIHQQLKRVLGDETNMENLFKWTYAFASNLIHILRGSYTANDPVNGRRLHIYEL